MKAGRPRRVTVVGCSGSGKSRLARRLAERLGAPHLELDSIFHQADWTPLDTDEFLRRAGEFTAADTWVVDGNYRRVQDLTWGRADTIVWLDLPRRTVMRQLGRRTARRVLTRQRLWNGNRERFRNVLSRKPEQNILLWAWRRHGTYREQYSAARDNPTWAHLHFVQLTSHADADRWLATVRPAAEEADNPADTGDRADLR